MKQTTSVNSTHVNFIESLINERLGLQPRHLPDPVCILAHAGVDGREAGAVGGTARGHTGHNELAVLLTAQGAATVALQTIRQLNRLHCPRRRLAVSDPGVDRGLRESEV